MTRTVGIILLIAAIGLCVVGSVFLVALRGEGATTGGTTLGFVILFLLVAPLAGAGVFVMLRGRREEAAQAEADKQRKLLDMIKARGQVSVSDAIIELQSDFQSIKDMVYKLVGLGVFSGYVNWDEGTLYSADAAEVRAISECKNCGAKLNFAGKGVQQCPNCGTEYFIAR